MATYFRIFKPSGHTDFDSLEISRFSQTIKMTNENIAVEPYKT